jgi:HK97 family phage prohead protease
MLKRAYSLLEIKAVDEEKREITGIATTPTTDRYGDVVEPKGAEFTLPLPFLWQHDASQPIGHVTKARASGTGIEVVVKIIKTDEPGTLKDRLDEAWQSIKLKLVRGLSIGFTSIEHAYLEDTRGIHFLKWAWLELSAVTIPANAEASIQTIKSIDTKQRAASGRELRSGVILIPSPPASRETPPAAIRGPVKLIPRKYT